MRRLSVAFLVFVFIASFASVAFCSKELVIYHWWTAGGEKNAINKLFELFNERYPDIKVVENPIVGGGGITLRTVLMGLLAAGMPPDTFQSLSGADLKTYVDGGYLEPVDDIWQKKNLDVLFPELMKKMVSFGGHVYAIPMSIHRANWLFYNKKIFDELGLKPPRNFEELLEVAKTIKARRPGVWPISLATRDKWSVVFLFDAVLLSVGGPDTYEKYYTGQLDILTEPAIEEAFKALAKLVPYIYPYHSALTWDQAMGKVARGECAMMVLGDFAVGYLMAIGKKYGVDWGAVAFPAEPNVFLMIVDTFTLPKKAKNKDSARKWLEFIAEAEPEKEFTIIKGSIAPNKLVPVDAYPDEVRKIDVRDFRKARIVPSSIHGVLAPESFLSEYQDILINFLYSPDVTRVLRQIDSAMKFYKVAENSKWYWETK